jgi:small subunit ribosomal protein S13
MTENKTYSKKENQEEERIIRILSKDVPGNSKIYPGLARIKGVAWAFSNAICKVLKFNKNKQIKDLTEDEIKNIEDFIKNPKVPKYLMNRESDPETGEDKHLNGNDLELRNEFDVKRLRKVKSYRGFRHGAKLPLRGQRTKSNFRKNRSKGSGIKKKS